MRGVEEAEGLKIEKPTEKAVLGFCLSFAQNALQLVSEGAQNNVENIIQLPSDAEFDARELRRHMKRANDCKGLLENSNNVSVAAEDFVKEIVKSGGDFSVPGVPTYKMDVLAVLWIRMTMLLLLGVLFSSKDVLKHFGHPVAALHGPSTERGVRERVKGLARRSV